MGEQKTMNALEWCMLIALSVLWGGSFFFAGVAVKELPAFTIVTMRVGIAAVAMLILIHAIGLRMPKDPKIWLAFFGMGLLNNAIPFSLIVWGQTHIASGLASILNATTPLFAAIVAHLLTQDEKLTPNKTVGICIGFVGVAIMIGPEVLSGLGMDVWPQVAVLCAAISYSFAGIFGRRFKKMGITPLVTATGQVTASTILLLPVAAIIDNISVVGSLSPQTWGAIVCLALMSTALAYVIYFRILSTAGATNLMLVTFLVPVSAILLGLVFLGEALDQKHILGMFLIAIGLIAIDGRLVRSIRNRMLSKKIDPEHFHGRDI